MDDANPAPGSRPLSASDSRRRNSFPAETVTIAAAASACNTATCTANAFDSDNTHRASSVEVPAGLLMPDSGCLARRGDRVAHGSGATGALLRSEQRPRGTDAAGKELHDSVSLCIEHGVRFLVVGVYTVAAHGHPRLTKDLDVWVWVDTENTARTATLFDESGFGSFGLSAEDFAVEGQVVQLGYPPNRIDIMTTIAGVDFEGCWERRTEVLVDSLAVPFIDLEVSNATSWLLATSKT